MIRTVTACLLVFGLAAYSLAADSPPPDRKAAYVRAVTRGAGLMGWQQPGVSPAEREFRAHIERRKTEILAGRAPLQHPVMLSAEALEQARRTIAQTEWAARWARENREIADYVAGQPDDYVEKMIPELTPTNTLGFTCPNCVGVKSQEAMGISLLRWDHRNPDVGTCRRCGQVYPSEDYPETAVLHCPRWGQSFTFYENDRERARPDDRTGRLAYHWVNYPIHVSFTGVIRRAKIGFMIEAVHALALQYAISGETAYAERARDILLRLAHCYRNWLYHDYWDTFADCDPMYAAWHDRNLPLEWKRHLAESAFAKDSDTSAAMLQNYWGAGRLHTSTDYIMYLNLLARAYDLVHSAAHADGRPMWNDVDREKVERDLFLEYLMGAEPFLGGAGKTECVNNKAPRIYHAMATVGRCLGLPGYAETALHGYEAVRDNSFIYDGFSRESPAYTNMYLADLVTIPEVLHGFEWPAGHARQGRLDVYRTDSRLRLMYRAMIDQLRPDGRYPPLSDTGQNSSPSTGLLELALKRYPEYFEHSVALPLYASREPTIYALFNMAPLQGEPRWEVDAPESCFPAWMTAFLRHGQGRETAYVAMPFSPDGGHRHLDNLALFYSVDRQPVLGDHGYLGDMPVNAWIKSTFSHNLVIVDDAEQLKKERMPHFLRMFTSPQVSMVEAGSDCYQQCAEYSRLVAMIKGPDNLTFLVDVFRVRGGGKHAYRVFSDIASSSASEAVLEFAGLNMPAEPPLPQVGASLAREDIFGLRDVRSFDNPPDEWQATWKQSDRQYRLWVLTPTDSVQASNGPGQRTLDEAGRRVRYVDVVRKGQDLASTFVAVHEPSGAENRLPIRSVQLVPLPASAGPQAVALRIDCQWGSYLLLNRFAAPAEIDGLRFQGQFALMHEQGGRRRVIAQEAATCMLEHSGVNDVTPAWSAQVTSQTESSMVADYPRPLGWSEGPADVQQYLLIRTDEQQTGFPLASATEREISVERFPLPQVQEFCLPNLVVLEK